jgi:hypothetical protein
MQNPSHTLSWQGLSVALPPDWNLAHYQGDARRGLITIADLRGPVLTIRWQTHRKPEGAMAKLVASLQKQGAKVTPPLPGGDLAVTHESFTGRLLSASTRLYEIEATDGQRDVPATVQLADYSTQQNWPWELYGIKGMVPRRLKLVKVSLHPGRPQLTFRRFWTVIQLGSWPMAQTLLDGRDLTTWAKETIPLLRNSKSIPHQSAPTELQYKVAGRLGRVQRFTLTQDADSNTIRWSKAPEGTLNE